MSELFDQVKKDAYLRLKFNQRKTTNLHLDERVYEKGQTMGRDVRRSSRSGPPSLSSRMIIRGRTSLTPAAICFTTPRAASCTRKSRHSFRLLTGRSRETLRAFHEPVQSLAKDNLFRLRPFFRCPVLIPAYQRYAILYSGMSNKRHLNDMEFLYRTLIDIYGSAPTHIQAISYDGTLNTQEEYSRSGRETDTAYRIQITGDGTRAALETAIDNLKTNEKVQRPPTDSYQQPRRLGRQPRDGKLLHLSEWDGLLRNDFADKLASCRSSEN